MRRCIHWLRVARAVSRRRGQMAEWENVTIVMGSQKIESNLKRPGQRNPYERVMSEASLRPGANVKTTAYVLSEDRSAEAAGRKVQRPVPPSPPDTKVHPTNRWTCCHAKGSC